MPTITVDVQLTVGAASSLASVIAEPDSTVIWTNDSYQYPKFKIVFVGPSPTNTVHLSGSVNDPVKMLVTGGVGTYHYVIEHKDASGDTQKISGPFPCSVHQCGGACP